MAARSSLGIAGKFCLASEWHPGRRWSQSLWRQTKGSIKPVILINLGEQETQIFIWLHKIFGVVMSNWGFDFSCFSTTSLAWSRVLLVLRGYKVRSGNTEWKLWFFSKLVTEVWLNAIRIGIKSRQTIFPGVILHRTDYKCSGIQVPRSFIISCFFQPFTEWWSVGSDFLSLLVPVCGVPVFSCACGHLSQVPVFAPPWNLLPFYNFNGFSSLGSKCILETCMYVG